MSFLLVDIATKCGAKPINALISAIRDDAFDKSIFADHVRQLGDCQDIAKKTSIRYIEDDGFHPTPLSTPLGNGSSVRSVLYLTDPVSLLRKQMDALLNFKDFVFRPSPKQVRSNGVPYQTQPMETDYFHEAYACIRRRVIASPDETVVWNDNSPSHPRSFVAFCQLFSDKTVSSLGVSAFTAYPIHLVLLNTTPERREWLINNGLTLIGFLPASSASEDDDVDGDIPSHAAKNCGSADDIQLIHLSDGPQLTSSSSGRETNMLVLHHALRQSLRTLDESSSKGFRIHGQDGSVWNAFPTILSYCCDIPEAKNLSAVKHGLMVNKPCIRCMCTADLFCSPTTAVPRHRNDTLHIRSKVKECDRLIIDADKNGDRTSRKQIRKQRYDLLSDYSLAPWSSFLEDCSLVDPSAVPDLYSIFTFESLHNLFLGMSPTLKALLFQYLGSEAQHKHHSGSNSTATSFKNIRTSILRGCNTLLRYFENSHLMPGTRIDFSKKEASSQLNGFYTSTGLRGMLEGKDFKALDFVFPFIFAYVDTWLGYEDSAPLTKLHVSYTSLTNQIMSDNYGNGWSTSDLTTLRHDISAFKINVTSVFQPHCETGLSTLKYHLLDHLVTDLERFGSIRVLSASPFEHFNLHIKKAYGASSKRILTRTSETATILHFNLARQPLSDTPSTTKAAPPPSSSANMQFGLVKQGERIHLQTFKQHFVNASSESCPTFPFVNTLIRSLQRDAIHQFFSLLSDDIQSQGYPVLESSVYLTFVQSGYTDGGFTPSLLDCTESSDGYVLHLKRTYKKTRQRVFGISWDRKNMHKKQSFVVVQGDQNKEFKPVWVAHVLLLFYLQLPRDKEPRQYAFVQYMEVTKPLNGVDEALDCVCLRWSTDDEIDRTIDIPNQLNVSHIETAEWYDLLPFSSIIGTVQVLRSNIPIAPFSDPLPWPLHRFHVNKYFLSKDVAIDDEHSI